MKKYFIAFSLFAALFSCSTDEIPEQPANEPKVYEVSLGLAGEITSITESPITKAAPNDLYGIQVYSAPIENTGTDIYSNYAYGIYNDLSSAKIKLLEGYKYKFECTMVVNGKNRIYGYKNGTYFGYSAPFWVNNVGVGEVKNAFIYSVWNTIFFLNGGSVSLIDADNENRSYYRPNIDRYMGLTVGFVPTGSNSVSIHMKRAIFGVRFIAEGLTSGKLKINMDEAPGLELTPENLQVEDIFTFRNLKNIYSDNTYSEDVQVAINWQQNDSTTVPLASQLIKFKRNTRTTIKVKVADLADQKSVSLNFENTPIAEGDSISFNY